MVAMLAEMGLATKGRTWDDPTNTAEADRTPLEIYAFLMLFEKTSRISKYSSIIDY